MAQLGQAQGQAQLVQAKAKEEQMKLQQMVQMQQLLKQAAAGAGESPDGIPGYSGPQDMASASDFIASLQMKVGDVVGAQKSALNGANIRAKTAYAAHQEWAAAEEKSKIVKANLAMKDTLLSRVHDQASLDESNTMYTAITGGPSKYAGRDWNDPETQRLIAADREALRDQEKKIRDDLEAKKVAAQIKNWESQEESRKVKNDMLISLEPHQEAHLDRMGKIGGKKGGKVPGAPNKDQETAAYMKIDKAYPKLSDSEKAQKARALAARAIAIKIAHPALDDDQAQQVALSQISPEAGITYQTGETPIDALPPPPDFKFEVGKYYRSATGKGVGKFTGSGFEPAKIEFGDEEPPEPIEPPPEDAE